MKRVEVNLKKYWYILLFLILAFIITTAWFHSGKMLAGGEEGIPFYDASRVAKLYSSAWYSTGTGYLIPVILPRAPLFFVVQFLQSIFVPWITQAIVYFSLIFSAFVSMHTLCKRITNNSFAAFIASLFYFFNLYSMTQVWGRFLLTNFFAWAYLPLALFLWIKIIEEKKPKWIVFFLLSSLVFCYSYGMPAMLIVLWVPLLSFLLVKLFTIRNKYGEIKKIVIKCTVTITFWIVINSWWMFPYIKLSESSFSTLTNPKSNLDSLTGVSQYFPNTTLFLLRQNYLLGPESTLFYFYSNPVIYIGSIVILLVCLYGALTFRKNKFFPFLIITFTIAWFLSKGTNFPLGTVFYSTLFHIFPFTTSLRNSYEKVGILFLLFYAIFFGIGIASIYKKTGSKILITLISLGFVILVWPLLTGQIFKKLSVEIPTYYKETNDFINSQNHGRILILPIIPGDGVQYIWPSGKYTGLEASEFLFDKPAVSKILRAQYFDRAYLSLYEKFVNGKDYNEILNNMDIRYIILHNDLNSTSSGASTSAQAKATLDNNPRVKLLKKFGELSVYRYDVKEKGLFAVRGSNAPKISYKKINNTRYFVFVDNAIKPYDLIFKETYSDFWHARISNNILINHTIFDNYSNMWHIEKTGSYVIEVSL